MASQMSSWSTPCHNTAAHDHLSVPVLWMPVRKMANELLPEDAEFLYHLRSPTTPRRKLTIFSTIKEQSQRSRAVIKLSLFLS